MLSVIGSLFSSWACLTLVQEDGLNNPDVPGLVVMSVQGTAHTVLLRKGIGKMRERSERVGLGGKGEGS